MKPKRFKRQRKRVRCLLNRWIETLGLGLWNIDVFYRDDRQESSVDTELFGEVYADWRYMQAALTIWVPVAKHLTDEHLERCVVHELCHILVNEAGAQHDHEERVCTTLAKAFLWTHNAGVQSANV